MKKKLLSLMLTLVICISAFPMLVNAGQINDLVLNVRGAAAGNLETDGYHWDETAYTLELKDLTTIGRLSLPDEKPVTIKLEGTNKIVSMDFAKMDSAYRSRVNTITFTGTGELIIEQSIYSNCGDTFVISEGATLTQKFSLNFGGSGGTDGRIEVNGNLNVILPESDTYSNAIYTGTMKIGATGKVYIESTNGIQLNGRSNGDNSNCFVMDKGARFEANCKKYSLLIFTGFSQITKDDFNSLVTLPQTMLNDNSNYELAVVSEDNGSTEYGLTITQKGQTPELIYGDVENSNSGKLVLSDFEMAQGSTNSWKHGSTEPLSFHSSSDFSLFEGVKVDAQLVDSGNYTVSEGSTVVALTPDYLKGLSDGNHTIAILYSGGAVTDEFSIAHNYDNGWKSDENSHWNECSCGAIGNKGDHTFVEVIDQEPTATQSGSKHQECSVCGYKMGSQTIPALEPTDDTKSPNTGATGYAICSLALGVCALAVVTKISKKSKAQ